MVNYSRLEKFEKDEEKMKAIHYVLREIGCRYVGEDMNKGWKVKSLTHNFNKLQQFDSGPKGFLSLLEDLINSSRETSN